MRRLRVGIRWPKGVACVLLGHRYSDRSYPPACLACGASIARPYWK